MIVLPTMRGVFSSRLSSAVIDPADYSPALWLDASDLSTLFYAIGTPSANGQQVRYWYCKALPTRILGTASTGPVRTDAGRNGLTTVRFSGANTQLVNGGAHGLPYGGAARTVFSVYQRTTGNRCHFMYGAVTTNALYAHGGSSTGLHLYRVSNDLANARAAGYYALCTTESPGSSPFAKSYVNNVAGSKGSASNTSISGSGIIVGGIPTLSFNHAGDVCEILVFPYLMTDTQRGEIFTYLQSKWGI